MIPTSRLTTTVRVEKTVPPFGNSMPIATNRALRPFAIARPRKRPTIEASAPTTNASTMTVRSTCRREPPIVRSVANSRTRCAMVIDSVFEITNAPTKSAIPPKASRNFCIIPSEE